MPFDRAAILREAHATARQVVAMYRAAECALPYRQTFASALRDAWCIAREMAEVAAYEASLPPIPADIAQRIREVETDAWFAPITSRGNDEYAALMGRASLMREAAREAAFHA